MLAYVFWHVAAAHVAVADYQRRLVRFHAALRAERPAGLRDTATFALRAVPWLGGAPGYEDWYLVEDFVALGGLEQAAVAGRRREPHDAAAALAGRGVAGVMGHVAGPPLPDAPGWGAWLSKPAGTPYPAFHAELAGALDGASAWQRRMVLGPATEYCVLAPVPLALPWPVQAWPLRAVVGPAR